MKDEGFSRKKKSVWEYQWDRCAADRPNNGWNWMSVFLGFMQNTSCCSADDWLTNHSNNLVFNTLIQLKVLTHPEQIGQATSSPDFETC